jgi:two-component system C4-dicarboxylate transport response regulator DctD
MAEASQTDELFEASRVLLVDDQPEVRRVVRRNLVRAGYVVVEAWNARVAVELARDMTFDLVISDLRMPDMSGVELLKALHEHDPDLPVVLTSGSPDPLTTAEARALGVFAYLAKPVPFDIMCETASRAVEQRRASYASREQFEPCASGERLRVAPREDGEDDDAG